MSRPPTISEAPASTGRPDGPPTRLAYRKADLSAALGISERTIERELSAGRFPRPDLHIGKMPLWTPETIRAWVESGGAR
jgi:predicted DNA-binding transcriptional regulator AlpA